MFHVQQQLIFSLEYQIFKGFWDSEITKKVQIISKQCVIYNLRHTIFNFMQIIGLSTLCMKVTASASSAIVAIMKLSL